MLGTTSASTKRRTASRTISCSSDHSNTIDLRSPSTPTSWCSRGYPRSAYSRYVRLKRHPEQTAYDRWGGAPFFTTLIERFYEGVAADPLLRPMYPDDLTESKAHLALFLMQYWGGPRAYSEQRGHPRLRMRHVPFAIGSA